MEQRLLLYHSALHHKHKLPVRSVILYPFEANYPVPPYRERIGESTQLTFDYEVFVLREKDAREYVQGHTVCLYTLLPGMKNATVPLLKHALRQMRLHYTNDKRFGEHLVRFQTIMWRSKMMDEPEKREIEEELKVIYKIDQFIDGNSRVEERIAQRVAQERAEGKAEGKAEGMQQLILDAIKEHFPMLADQIQPQIEQMQDTAILATLFRQLLAATAERDARRILQIQENQ